MKLSEINFVFLALHNLSKGICINKEYLFFYYAENYKYRIVFLFDGLSFSSDAENTLWNLDF